MEPGVIESAPPLRSTLARIDLDAIAHNVRVLRRVVAPSTVWAVVKANGYGHGAVEVARAALAAGAEGLCVALTQEGVELRDAGIEAPILLLSEQPVEQMPVIVAERLTPTLYSEAAIMALARVGAPLGYRVHLKLDTGMHRVGARPTDVRGLIARATHVGLWVDGIFTHLACADEPANPANAAQLAEFVSATRGLDPSIRLHAANSAAAFALDEARYSFVRAGIALYGVVPGPGVADLCADLRPAMSLHSAVSFVKRVAAGDGVSYGLRHRFERSTTVATVPLGYADGVPRPLAGDVLIDGQRCPIVGVVTMDQLMVDVGELDVRVGDPVVLIGRQGDEQIAVDEWANAVGTIGYEVVCRITGRVPRVYDRSGR